MHVDLYVVIEEGYMEVMNLSTAMEPFIGSTQTNDTIGINYLPNAEAEEAGTSRVTSITAPNQRIKLPVST